MKWLKCLLALCVLVVSQLVVASSSYAASDYDGVFRDVSYLHITNGSEDQNISATYEQIIEDHCPTELYNQFSSNISNDYSTFIRQNKPSDTNRWVDIYQGSPSAPLIEYMDFGSVKGFLLVSNTRISLTMRGDGVPQCSGVIDQYAEGHSPYTALLPDTYTFIANWPIFYPSGYAGEYPKSAWTPPQPVLYSGTVDCFGETPLAMIIAQDANDGSATLTPESLGSATWEYALTSDQYSIAVNCGGTWAYSDGSVSPSTTSGDWVCDPYTIRYDQAYCVLS
jgi:hypothetical protein